MIQAHVHTAEITENPGDLLHLMAEGLRANGIDVGPLRLEDEHCVPIACPHARCILTIHDDGLVSWEWCPSAGGRVDPKQLADVACTLLTGQAGEQPRLGDGYGRRTVTLKGMVGRELVARGLRVRLELHQDPVFYHVDAAIVAYWPDGALEAEVRVTDDGRLSWECDYGAGPAVIGGDPGGTMWALDPGQLAAHVVARITAAVSVAGSGLTGQRRSGSWACGRWAWSRLAWLASGRWR